MRRYLQILFLLAVVCVTFSSCEKFLEEKSDDSLAIPTTVSDFQAILNSHGRLNVDFSVAGEASADDYYISDDVFDALFYESEKRLYTWQPDYVTRPISSGGDEWYNCYKTVFNCNSVLLGLEDNKLSGPQADNVKGQALVFRAFRYLDGVQVWAPAYDKLTAHEDLGMVLRVDPDMNLVVPRSSVQETYDLIIRDLIEAAELLPVVQISASLPSKSLAYSLLSRTHLYMGNYNEALFYAEKAIENSDTQLLDFNSLDPEQRYPIPTALNISLESMFFSTSYNLDLIRQQNAKIDTTLYSMYEEGDLRKLIYFGENADGSQFFKGSFLGASQLTNTPTPSELYLIVAECYARQGNLEESEKALNKLLVTRWRSDLFSPVSFNNKEDALKKVLDERRKELVMRGLRWADIKRLNRDGANLELKRIVKGEEFILPANDLRYAIALPESVIELGGLEQNPR